MTNRKCMLRARGGFVLPLVLSLMVVATLVITAIVSYVSFAARYTRTAMLRDQCRLAAQTVIEQAKLDIREGFNNYISDSFSSIKISPTKAQSYNWFDEAGVSSDRRTIGTATAYPATIFAGKDLPIMLSDRMGVWVCIGNGVVHESNSPEAIVPLIATAVHEDLDGLVVSATVCEWMVFGTEQSKVFDNAYFVNNYGWMNGNFTINGEFRANGNVSLKNGAVVNGFIYAAPNSEIGAAGTVTVSSSTIYDQSHYRSSSSTRARYDTGNLDEIGSYDPAKSYGQITIASYDAKGNLVGGSMTSGDNPKAIVNQTQTIAGETSTVDPVPMPFVSELDPYVDYAQDENGTLSYPSVSYTDSAGNTCTVPAATINAHRSVSEAGPSGNTSLADAGSVLLVGTQSNPICINGPVVIDGDVIIKGYVSGQGTIYAGRNIHVIGDIKYVNAPTWTHSKTEDAATAEQTANESQDMLGLVAKGNIVIGNNTSSSVASSVNSGSDIAYSCDESDSAIGYPSTTYSSTKTTTSRYGGSSSTTSNTFSGDYTATEQINGLATDLASTAPGGYNSSSGQFGKVRTTTETYTVTEEYQVKVGGGRPGQSAQYETRTREVTKTRTVLATSYDRHYYETICDNNIITKLGATVSQIDAVMYNNHGVFGSLGANFSINGALICRDEGLTANGGSFNWDMRLRRKKNSSVVSAMGLPKGPGDPYVCRWMEVPDSLNPSFKDAYDAWRSSR